MNTGTANEHDNGAEFLPNFCSGGAVFSMLVITELVAILITLAAVDATVMFWQRFLLLSIYLQWIGITSAAGLCLIRSRIRNLSRRAVAGLCYILLLLITLLLSELAWQLAYLQDLFFVLQTSHAEFLTRNLGVCAIVSIVALRYFWIQHQWQREMLSVGNARFAALQARIQPHFLFNTLNSIAELSASRPHDAETAVEDLSALLRATLDEHDQPIALAQEVDIAQAYARIEGLRLGERLRIEWDIPDALLGYSIPPLSLQPLLENAVRHGVEPLPEGGVIYIQAQQSDAASYTLTVTNPVGNAPPNPGTGEALLNIRQRLRWLYGDESAQLRVQQTAGHYEARLLLPCKPSI